MGDGYKKQKQAIGDGQGTVAQFALEAFTATGQSKILHASWASGVTVALKSPQGPSQARALQ
jgi:hypothetical protein